MTDRIPSPHAVKCRATSFAIGYDLAGCALCRQSAALEIAQLRGKKESPMNESQDEGIGARVSSPPSAPTPILPDAGRCDLCHAELGLGTIELEGADWALRTC